MKTKAATIDFGTSKIVTLYAESGGFNRCDIIGSGTVPYDGYMDGDWNDDRETLKRKINDSVSAAELEAKEHISEIYVGVPSEYIRVLIHEGQARIMAEDGRVTDDDLDNVQDDAAEKLNLQETEGIVIHRSPAWFAVDDGPKGMQPVGTRGNTIKGLISFITADSYFINDIRDLLCSMGLTVLGFLSPTLGTSELLIPIAERDRAAALIDVGYLNTEVSIVQGDALIYHAVLPRGGADMRAGLATELQISFNSAERLKRDYVFMPDEFDQQGDPEVIDESGNRISFSKDRVQRIVEQASNELIEMIDLTIKDARDLLTAKSQIYLTGGGLAMMRGGREMLAKKLGRTVKGALAKATKLTSPAFASSLGLANLVFDSIEQRSPQDESLPGRLADGLRNMFSRK